ncbi:tripartite tricarboxylate transporter substrate binding protein [Rhodovarius crocodyli]|uniref:Tripartite tricarboxylate transporter substrate binding protein n=1 Tax=Rhodovarius crocodyli TaxID=1979269 RepID=A0A437LWA3_9PROT|nr:tripartite tricarboxylate transporter substrate binding protein [Rhodovarius crocodyli]RVT89649.1 tripartite tricarboxylate transporter substrate binding protein [Rhodovarius crocodyli]
MRIRNLLVALAALVTALPAAAQFPDRPVRLIVPYPPGATNDILGRAFAEQMTRELGQPVVVENRGGAGTAIGAQATANARADGYTILLGTGTTFTLNPAVTRNLPYDPIRDFQMVSIVAEVPIIFITNPRVPARNLRELVAYAQANPGRVNFSSSGPATSLHLAGEMFARAANIGLTHVPYQGSAPAMLAVTGGDVQMMSEVVSGAVPAIQGNRVVPIAVTSEQRLSILPDVPTVAESGYPGFQALGWYGLAVPRATPAPIVERLREATNRVMAANELRARFEPTGLIILQPRTGAEVDMYMDRDRERWVPLVRALNLTAE